MEWNNKYISNMESKDRHLDNNNKYKNSNMCIFGTSGAGKSYYTKLLILIAAFVIIAVIAFVVINHFVKKDGAFVQIKVDGQVVNTIPVNQNETLTIEGYQGGSNIVTIENGGVTMTDADCPDKLCVKTGRISKTGETIVCLPHRVVVEIIGAVADDSGVDSIVR